MARQVSGVVSIVDGDESLRATPQRGAGASPVTARGPHGGITDRVRRPRADPTGASTSS